MAFWTMAYRGEPADGGSREGSGSFYWQDADGASGPGDVQGDLFGQFVDFDAEGNATAGDGFHVAATVAAGPEAVFLVDGQHHATESTGSSTADDFDLFSNSSRNGAATSAASHEIDPKELTVGGEQYADQSFEYLGRGSMSETDLSRLEGISLHSPRKNVASASHPSSPTPPNTGNRKPNKFVEALSSTIRKATALRKTRKPHPGQDRPGSPTLDHHHHQSLKPPKQRRGRSRAVTQGNMTQSPPTQPGSTQFVHGFCEDPFNDGHSQQLPATSSVQYYAQAGIEAPLDSPGVKSEPGPYPAGQVHVPTGSWPQHQQHQQHQHQHQHQQHMMPAEHWTGTGGEYIAAGPEQGWWELGMFAQGPHANGSGEFANHHHNLASHAQHSGMPYEYAPMPDTSSAGLMIHMPQPRPPQPTVVGDMAVNAHTYLPPPPPAPPVAPATDRPHRPPRAKSSGARHLSCSPMRRQRAPSASPTPGQQPHQQQPGSMPRSRHSSGASVSSTRSSSGRLPGSMPGTPCSVRKRRSRDPSGVGGSLSAEMGGGGGGDIGFVNFTPHDGSLLMTGVAPSGSSKTKARREKEAQDRRRRLSEAALKAVAAAGGDVDKLLEQGFAF